MGQLTNLFVSESYQGLLKLTDSSQGVTGTLQSIQDGVGNDIPIKVSNSDVVITGSITNAQSSSYAVSASEATHALSASYAPMPDVSGLVTTSSFNSFTSSIDGRVDALELETSSLQNQIDEKLNTSSFNSYTSSNDDKVNSLISATGSYATTSSLTSLSSSIATTDLGQDNRLSSIEGITGSLATTSSLTSLSSSIAVTDLAQDNRLNSIEGITGSFATTSSVTSLSSSIAITDLAQDNRLSSLETNSGSQQLEINQKLDSSSFNSYTSSNDSRVNSLESKTGSYATTGSNVFQGTQTISGSVNITGELTALSASITYLETIYQTSSVLFSSGSNILGDEAGDTQTLFGTVRLPNGPLVVTGSVRATNFTGSLQGNATTATSASQAQNAVSASQAQNAVSTSFATTANNSSNLGGIAASQYARRNDENTFTEDQTIESGSSLITNRIETPTDERLEFLSLGDPTGTAAEFIFRGRNDGSDRNITVAITGSLVASQNITAPAFIGLASNSTNLGGRGVAQFVLTGSFNDYTSSNDTRVNSLINATSSYVTETESGSFMTTGSVSGDTLTFTKGDGSQFSLQVNTGSLPSGLVSGSSQISYTGITDVPSGIISGSGQLDELGYATTSSVNTKLDTSSFNTYSGDTLNLINTKLDTGSFNTYSGDTLNLINTKLDSSSFNSYTSSNDSKVNDLISKTGSYVTETESGSFITNISSGPASFEDLLIITKGDGSSYNLTVNNVTNADSSSFSQTSVSASYATNALSASYAPQDPLPSGLVSGSSQISYTGITDVPSGIVSGSSQVSFTGITDVPSGLVSGSSQISDLGYAITGSNTFLGDQTITGSVNITGSLNVNGNSSLSTITPGVVKPNITFLGGANHVTNQTVLTNYLNAITTSLNNNDTNFAMMPGAAIAPIGLNNLTGSLLISGSNNFIQNLGSQLPPAQGRRGVIGAANYVISTPNVNTSSLTIPNITNNYLSAIVQMTLTTGSNAGNNAHAVTNNVVLGPLVLNHPSASIGAGQSSVVNANINVGQLTSNASFRQLTNVFNVSNNINSNPNITLNHFSSSVNFTQNIIGGNITTFNNRYFNTGSNNILAVSANILSGQSLVINAGGSPSTNVARTLVGNLIGGQNVNISLEKTGTDLGGLRNSIVYGIGLNITGSHSAGNTTQQGAAFFGRYNSETGGLNDTATTIFAVGTGTGNANRNTSLYVTTGSLVGVSGSLNVIGQTTLTGNGNFPLTVDGTINSKRLHFNSNPFNNDPSSNLGAIRLDGTNQTFYSTNYDLAEITTQSQVYQTVSTGSGLVETGLRSNNMGSDYNLSLINQSGTGSLITNANVGITGSLGVSGSLRVGGNLQFNGAQYSSLQTLSGSANVSQSVYFDTTGPQFGVSLVDNTKLTVANSGTYNIQFSAQLLADTGADNTHVWFKKNGTNIAGSATQIALANNEENVVTVNILDTAVANDYYEIAWQSTNGDAVLLYEGATGNIPSIPSVITTVTQVR